MKPLLYDIADMPETEALAGGQAQREPQNCDVSSEPLLGLLGIPLEPPVLSTIMSLF